MARDQSPLTNWLQYVAVRVAALGIEALPVSASLWAVPKLGRWSLCGFHRRHCQRADRHLAMAMPELSQAQRKRITHASFEHYTHLAIEVLYAPRVLHRDTWHRHVELGDLSEAICLLNSPRPKLLITGHLGNWEILGFVLAVLGYRLDAIARPIDNPLVNDWLLGIRQRRGMRIITKWNATDRMLSVLEGGGALGFIADQNAGDRGLFVPFFGRLASTYKSIGLLAIRQEAPIICGYAHRIQGQYRYHLDIVDIIYPEQWDQQDDPLYYVTARYMRAIETMVRRCPHQYLWMHRRWKSRPRFEREGKPMPASLRAKLEALPWMDDQLLASVQQPVPSERQAG